MVLPGSRLSHRPTKSVPASVATPDMLLHAPLSASHWPVISVLQSGPSHKVNPSGPSSVLGQEEGWRHEEEKGVWRQEEGRQEGQAAASGDDGGGVSAVGGAGSSQHGNGHVVGLGTSKAGQEACEGGMAGRAGVGLVGHVVGTQEKGGGRKGGGRGWARTAWRSAMGRGGGGAGEGGSYIRLQDHSVTGGREA